MNTLLQRPILSPGGAFGIR